MDRVREKGIVKGREEVRKIKEQALRKVMQRQREVTCT